ncbi:TetR family transcriptional regulator [Catellatospora sp. IY07-71]|uniref:TetR/AcrR family transcriptional regulator n=1 Tax=Catellatospora sp. IY07-71 TaxID=2728827 RepID=UPI001BB44FFB|nr:TetR family transcriptional regulator [Catellatospora sp. IY07-71]BCJ72005.1 TetR family transcriptional regulator [Catellatospora sp. IY07-71]
MTAQGQAVSDPPAVPGWRRPGRRPGAHHTADRILDTALAMFAESGLDSVTVRGIAARADVDAALVHHFYRSKEGLFTAAVDGAAVPPGLAELLREPLTPVGEALVALFLAHWERPEVRPRLLAVLRSVPSSPVAAGLMRDCLDQHLTAALAEAGADRAAERAALIGAQLIGLAIVRYVLRSEPLASLPVDRAAAAAGPVMEMYLAGPVARLRRAG